MSTKVWIDGKFFDKYDAKISVFDHGLLFGDGVWIGTRIFHGRAFRLDEYLEQLQSTASAYSLTLPMSREELAKAVADTIHENGRNEGYLRVTVTRGAGTLGLDPRKCAASVIVIAEDAMPYPREVVGAGLDAAAVSGPLPNPPTLLSQNVAVFAKAAAQRAGCLEAVLLDPDGGVVRATDGEVFAVIGGALTRSNRNWGTRDQVVMDLVWELAESANIPTAKAPLTLPDLLAADEVLLMGIAAGFVTIRSIDGQMIGSGTEGPVTKRLRAAYHRATRGEYQNGTV